MTFPVKNWVIRKSETPFGFFSRYTIVSETQKRARTYLCAHTWVHTCTCCVCMYRYTYLLVYTTLNVCVFPSFLSLLQIRHSIPLSYCPFIRLACLFFIVIDPFEILSISPKILPRNSISYLHWIFLWVLIQKKDREGDKDRGRKRGSVKGPWSARRVRTVEGAEEKERGRTIRRKDTKESETMKVSRENEPHRRE